MKVKFKKLENDNILMTFSSGLDIVIDRLEVSMISDAVNEYIENELRLTARKKARDKR